MWPRRRGRARAFALAAALAALVLVAFAQAASFPFASLDDAEYVIENPPVRAGLSAPGVAWAFSTTYAANWHPLTWLSHMADVSLFGMDPGAHHLVNLFLHLAGTLLLFAALLEMTQAPWQSAFAAALFGIHPLHVEPVAWVAERKELLCGVFVMLTLWSYARYARAPSPSRYLRVAAFLVLALLSKPMAVTLPFALLLLDAWPLGRFGAGRSAALVREKIPLFLAAAASCAATYFAQRGGGTFAPFPVGVRIANAFLSYAAYLQKTVWPAGLSVLYPHPWTIPGGMPAWRTAAAVAAVAAITLAVLRQRTRRPWLATGWLWYLGTLVPVIGLVQVGGQGMADRYTYLPLIGIFVAAAWGASDLAARPPWRRQALAAGAAAALLALTAAARVQAGYWRSNMALWGHALEVTRENWQAHNGLGLALAREGRLEEAVGHYRAAVEIWPDSERVHANLADSLNRLGRADEAVRHYREALRIEPRLAAVRANLGNLLLAQGDVPGAVAEYREALAVAPGLVHVRYNLATALARQGRLDESADAFREVLRVRPDFAAARLNFGNVLMMQGRSDEAAAQYDAALRLRSNGAGGARDPEAAGRSRR